MPSLLDPMALRQPALARGEAALLSLGFSNEEQDQVKALLASSADPDAASHYLVKLWQQHPDALHRFAGTQPVLKYLLTVAGGCHFARQLQAHPHRAGSEARDAALCR